MGIRGPIHTLLFNDVKVKKNRSRWVWFNFAMSVLNGGRIGIASQALGIATGSYELALKYSQERKAFGKEIFKHQAIAFKLVDMATQITAAKMLVLKAATEKTKEKTFLNQEQWLNCFHKQRWTLRLKLYKFTVEMDMLLNIMLNV
jgi:alkylation response protein AidB-like acyl-CoA dehydrogenase